MKRLLSTVSLLRFFNHVKIREQKGFVNLYIVLFYLVLLVFSLSRGMPDKNTEKGNWEMKGLRPLSHLSPHPNKEVLRFKTIFFFLLDSE